MSALLRYSERAVDGLTVLAFLAMFGIIVVQVFLRYVLNDPLVWSEEAAQYCFVWIAFLGIIRAARNRTHICIDVVVKRLAPAALRAVIIVWKIIEIVFSGMLVWYGIGLAQQNLTVSMTSMPLPYWIVYAIVPVCGVALIGYALRDIVVPPPPAGAAKPGVLE